MGGRNRSGVRSGHGRAAAQCGASTRGDVLVEAYCGANTRRLPPHHRGAAVTAPDVAVSVIVLNYNGRRWLAGCLDALAAQRGIAPFETILVDNASSDGSAAFVRTSYPAVVVHETGSNLGFAAGNNA